MVFPTAGIEVAIWVPPLVAFVISFFTSMGGVSGAFLLLPFQMSFLGYTAPSVSATNQLFNIVAIPSGVWRYVREGRMVWPLAWVVIIGTLPGVLIGAVVRVAWVPDPGSFRLFAALVLLYIGGKMGLDQIRSTKTSSPDAAEAGFRKRMQKHQNPLNGFESNSPLCIKRVSFRQIAYEFYGERYKFSTPGIFALSVVVGIVGGIYGIGGGAIIAPFFITVFGLPVYTVAGAALMGTFVTSIAGVAFYQGIAPLYPELSVAPDWSLGLLFGLGGAAGMYLGARCQKFVPAWFIKWMLCGIIFFTAVRYIVIFFK